jgi:hypothetical protein
MSDKLYSERFLNACDVVCPVWNGTDSYGRFVNPDTVPIETAGCRSALDRVAVENYHRPQYFNFVSLDGYGIHGNLSNEDASARTTDLRGLHTMVGSCGTDYGSSIKTRCGRDTYREFDRGMIN